MLKIMMKDVHRFIMQFCVVIVWFYDLAIWKIFFKFLLIFSSESVDAVKFLVKHGANIKAVDNDGKTPLDIALELG